MFSNITTEKSPNGPARLAIARFTLFIRVPFFYQFHSFCFFVRLFLLYSVVLIRYYCILYHHIVLQYFYVYQNPLNAGSGRRLHSKCNVISSLNLLQKRPQKASKRASKRKPFLEAIFEPQTCNLLPELEESESKDGKRQRMTYSTSGVHVSLQRDAFSLVHLYKKRETYEYIGFFVFYPYSFCSRHDLRIQLSQTFSHTAFANYPSDLLLHVSITRCVRSLTSCFFFPRYTHSLFSFTISQKSSHLEQMPKQRLGLHGPRVR